MPTYTPAPLLPFQPIPGLEVAEMPGEFGWAQFRAAERAFEMPIHVIPWADTEKDPL